MQYVVEKRKNGRIYRYWCPKEYYFVCGVLTKCPFRSVTLPSDKSWISRAQELNHHLERWRAGGVEAEFSYPHGTLGWLVGEYKRDDWFTELAPLTRKKNLIVLNHVVGKYGDVPAGKISRMVARAYCMSFDAKSRRTLTASVCGRVYTFGENIGAVKENPFSKMELARMKPRQMVGELGVIAAIQENAIKLSYPSMALAIQLGLDVGQRAGDLRVFPWTRYTGSHLGFHQSKTDAYVQVRVMKELKEMLDNTARTSPVVLIFEDTNAPYSKDDFSRTFRLCCDGVEGADKLQFRDLRRTAVVRLAEAGCTIPEICAITGHTLEEAHKILEVYLPRNSKMADAAIEKLESKK